MCISQKMTLRFWVNCETGLRGKDSTEKLDAFSGFWLEPKRCTVTLVATDVKLIGLKEERRTLLQNPARFSVSF